MSNSFEDESKKKRVVGRTSLSATRCNRTKCYHTYTVGAIEEADYRSNQRKALSKQSQEDNEKCVLEGIFQTELRKLEARKARLRRVAINNS